MLLTLLRSSVSTASAKVPTRRARAAAFLLRSSTAGAVAGQFIQRLLLLGVR